MIFFSLFFKVWNRPHLPYDLDLLYRSVLFLLLALKIHLVLEPPWWRSHFSARLRLCWVVQLCCGPGWEPRAGKDYAFFSLPPLSRKTPSCMNTSRQATVYRSCDFPMLPRPNETSDVCWLIGLIGWDFILLCNDATAREKAEALNSEAGLQALACPTHSPSFHTPTPFVLWLSSPFPSFIPFAVTCTWWTLSDH